MTLRLLPLWYAEGTEQPQGTKGLTLNLLLSLRQCPESTSHSVAKHQHDQRGLLLSSSCFNVECKKINELNPIKRPNLANVFSSYENQCLLNFSFGVNLMNPHTNDAHVLKIKHGV